MRAFEGHDYDLAEEGYLGEEKARGTLCVVSRAPVNDLFQLTSSWQFMHKLSITSTTLEPSESASCALASATFLPISSNRSFASPGCAILDVRVYTEVEKSNVSVILAVWRGAQSEDVECE